MSGVYTVTMVDKDDGFVELDSSTICVFDSNKFDLVERKSMFKVNDFVRRKKEDLEAGNWDGSEGLFIITQLHQPTGEISLRGRISRYDQAKFDLVKSAEDINMTDKYETMDGEPVRVLVTDLKDSEFPIMIAIDKGDYELAKGLRAGGLDTQFRQCIRKVDPYRDFKIDKVEVRGSEEDVWCKHYFAGVIDGSPSTFKNGRSSFTANNITDTVSWEFCRKYSEEN